VTTVLSFVVVLGILILIHELGHFLVARWAGVGVERFSIGFGPVLLRWRGKETEYALSAIPMGGYVKMMGEESALEGGGTGVVDPAKAFSFKPLWKRFLIVFAGPGMNLVLAAVIFTGLLMVAGRQVWPAVLGNVNPDGPAAAVGLQTGDRVVGIGDRPVNNWEDFTAAVNGSDGKPIAIRVERGGQTVTAAVTPRRSTVKDVFDDPREVWDMGAGPLLTPQVTAVTPGWPADKAGFKPSDVVLAVAGKRVYTPTELTQEIQKRPGETFLVTVERDGKPVELTVTANREKERSPTGKELEVGKIGIAIESKVAVAYVRADPLTAIWQGVAQTWNMTAVTVTGLWKLISGKIDSSNIGGPIQIATEAGRQARQGLAALAIFTAIISVNLAVLNLLPVPMLDGGHLLFFVIEAVLGHPLSTRKREAAQQLGFVLLMLLMVYALYNDLTRIDAFRFFR
jgi:regulator of sigma E protease